MRTVASGPPIAVVPKLRELLARYPQSDLSTQWEAEVIRLQYPHDLKQRLGALAAALRRYPDHPGTAELLRDVLATVRSFVGSTGLAKIDVSGASADFREAVTMIARYCRAEVLSARVGPSPWEPLAVASEFAEVNLDRRNTLLQDLMDVALFDSEHIGPCSAPALAGQLFLRERRFAQAAEQFRRVLQAPDIYSHRGLAELGLALCDTRPTHLADTLASLRALDRVEASRYGSGVIAANDDDYEIENLVHDLFANYLPDAALEAADVWDGAGFQRERRWAHILRLQRGRQFRRLALTIEDFTLRYPDHRETAMLFDRLCSVERRAIPDTEWAQGSVVGVQDSKVGSWLERSSQRVLRFTQLMARRARFNGDLPFDDDVFAARRAPPWFRARRVVHRALNRVAWNAHMRWQYEARPSSVIAQYDLADWHFREEYGSALGLAGNAAFESDVKATLPACKGLQDACAADGNCFAERAEGKVIAGPMMEKIARRLPRGRLQRRALLVALQSGYHALTSLDDDKAAHSRQARDYFARAQTNFAMLRDAYPRTEELIDAARWWHNIREMRSATPKLFSMDENARKD